MSSSHKIWFIVNTSSNRMDRKDLGCVYEYLKQVYAILDYIYSNICIDVEQGGSC